MESALEPSKDVDYIQPSHLFHTGTLLLTNLKCLLEAKDPPFKKLDFKLVRMKTSQAYLPVPSSTYLNSSFQGRLTINDIQELVYTYYSYFVTFLFNMLYLGTTPVYLVPFAQTDFCI